MRDITVALPAQQRCAQTISANVLNAKLVSVPKNATCNAIFKRNIKLTEGMKNTTLQPLTRGFNSHLHKIPLVVWSKIDFSFNAL